ncbi:MAG: hypothetical protein RDV41_01445 [Planctomycetota bacterium]|nr:hypothetical protein [Planctomycetota bacterium]
MVAVAARLFDTRKEGGLRVIASRSEAISFTPEQGDLAIFSQRLAMT